VIKSFGRVITFFDESRKSGGGSFGGKRVSLLYEIFMLMPNYVCKITKTSRTSQRFCEVITFYNYYYHTAMEKQIRHLSSNQN
jgi:hypothetical protein